MAKLTAAVPLCEEATASWLPAFSYSPSVGGDHGRLDQAPLVELKTASASSLRSAAVVVCRVTVTAKVEMPATGVPAARRTSFLWLLSLDAQGK